MIVPRFKCMVSIIACVVSPLERTSRYGLYDAIFALHHPFPGQRHCPGGKKFPSRRPRQIIELKNQRSVRPPYRAHLYDTFLNSQSSGLRLRYLARSTSHTTHTTNEDRQTCRSPANVYDHYVMLLYNLVHSVTDYFGRRPYP